MRRSRKRPKLRRVVNLAGKGKVLVVDDEDIVRRTAVHTLKQYGYEVIVANNGAEALQLFKENPQGFAAILLDLTMPVMGGEETLRQMRTLHPGIRVVLSSGYNEVEAIQRFTGKGLAGFLQKPYTSMALAQKLRDVLHLSTCLRRCGFYARARLAPTLCSPATEACAR